MQWGLPTAALVVVGLAAVVAFRVWRARGRAPRSLGLAFVLLTCVCGGLSMFDPRLPVHRVTVSLDELDQVLSSSIWRVWPRGEIAVRVSRAEMEKERDVGGLIETAISRGVRINVERADADDGAGVERRPFVRLVWRAEGGDEVELPETVAFVETGSASVWPELAGREESECRVDGGGWKRGASLEELFLQHGMEVGIGFHRVACREEGVEAVRYVLVSDRGVVLALLPGTEWTETMLKERLVGQASLEDPQLHGLLHPVLADVGAPPDTAGMLVLEHPSTREGCEAARTVLGRGGTVVLADPEDSFFDQCPELRLVGEGEEVWRRVDRRPRLSVVIDQSMDDLEWEPSCRFDERRCVVSSSADRRKAKSSKQQVDLAFEACAKAARMVDGGDLGCGVIERVAARCRARPERSAEESHVLAICKPNQAPWPTDEQRRDFSSLDASLERYLDEEGGQGTLRDNSIVLVFPHVVRDSIGEGSPLCRFARHEGGRVIAGLMPDRYGDYLIHLAEQEGRRTQPCGASVRYDALVARGSSGSGRPELLGSVVAHFDARSDRQATSATSTTGRFRSTPEADLLAPIRLRMWPEDEVETPPLGFPSRITSAAVETDGLPSRVLAAGTIVERGHLLVLGYSPFEFPDGVPLTDSPSSPRWKEARSASQGALGPAMLRDLYARTTPFLRASPGAILGVEETSDGRVSIQVIRSVDDGAEDLATLTVTQRSTRVHAPLVDVDVQRRAFTYALSSADVDELAPGHRCATGLVQVDDADASSGIVLCSPDQRIPEAIVLAGEPSLRALASFTGGCYVDEPCDPDAGGGPHDIWVLGTALGFLGLWGARVHRRIAARRVTALVRHDEDHARERYDQPQALAAAEGDWGLQTSSWPRTGAAGGYRSLEPGDRPSAVLPRDLLLMSRGELGGSPTVALRVVEAAPTTKVIVNLGATMRAPLAPELPPKVQTAIHVADLLLSTAWRRHGRASLVAIGVAGGEPLIGPVAFHPGHGVLSAVAAEALAGILEERWPWSSPADVGTVVYVSDFMQEDPEQLERWLRETEAAGTRVAGVLVYSPAELAMVEGGTLASSGAWVDRADWTNRDLELAFRQRFDRLDASFDITTGGLTIVDTTMSTGELRSCLIGRRLAEVFR